MRRGLLRARGRRRLSRLRMKVIVFPDFFHAYTPAPEHPLPLSRLNVIVVAVAEYLPRARAWPFIDTV